MQFSSGSHVTEHGSDLRFFLQRLLKAVHLVVSIQAHVNNNYPSLNISFDLDSQCNRILFTECCIRFCSISPELSSSGSIRLFYPPQKETPF